MNHWWEASAAARTTLSDANGRIFAGDRLFNTPDGLALDSQGNLYVADYDSNRVDKLSPDGTLLARFGAGPTEGGVWLDPVDVAADSDGTLYVLNAVGQDVVKVVPDGKEIAHWGVQVPPIRSSRTSDRSHQVFTPHQRRWSSLGSLSRCNGSSCTAPLPASIPRPLRRSSPGWRRRSPPGTRTPPRSSGMASGGSDASEHGGDALVAPRPSSLIPNHMRHDPLQQHAMSLSQREQ